MPHNSQRHTGVTVVSPRYTIAICTNIDVDTLHLITSKHASRTAYSEVSSRQAVTPRPSASGTWISTSVFQRSWKEPSFCAEHRFAFL